MKLPTDLQILNAIYEQYCDTFLLFDRNDPDRDSKIYVPVDSKLIGGQLVVDPNIVFGRLYYHLDHKHGYTKSDGTLVHFFALRVGGDVQCVNFPLLASVLADLRDDDRRQLKTRRIAWASLAIAIASVAIYVVIR